ncbi:MAG: hypothetical protein ACLPQS_10750 [Acidimicrobiales bacterium]
MHRKLLIVVSSLALPAMVLSSVSAAGATSRSPMRAAPAHEAAKVTLTGKMVCDLSGAIALSPAFTTTGTGKAATVTLSGKLTKCGGKKPFKQGKVTVTGGTITATGSLKDNSCANVALGGTLPGLKGTAKYTTKGGTAVPTSFSFSGGSFDSSGSPITVAYPGTGDTGSATGSFAGKKGGATADVKQTISQLLTACGSSSGLKSIGLSSGAVTFG